MRLPIITMACAAIGMLLACAPAFNWRDAAIAPTPLTALFPCKPELASRMVSMAGVSVELHMRHCDAQGVTTAVGHARLTDPSQAGPVLAQWRIATLAGLRASATRQSAWVMALAPTLPESQSVVASGTDAAGGPLSLRGAWFTRDGEVYAALVYGPAVPTDVADTFFDGLRFR